MTESIQKKLLRVSPPRVRITYDVETGGRIEQKELPFIIAVLADLQGSLDPSVEITPLKMRQMVALDRDNFDAAMAQFKPAESIRRGLQHLVMHLDTNAMLQIKVLDASKQELMADLEKAVEFDQSALFKLLYESTYGSFGGLPFSLLVGDYEISNSTSDITFLTKMSALAATAHAPFLTAASPALFGINSFADIGKPRDISKVFESTDSIGWNAFRQSEDSRYACLTVPRADFGSASFCNSAYILAARIGLAFSRNQWLAQFGEFEDDGFAPEVEITVHRAQELGALGFIPLCVRSGTTQTAFIGSYTSQTPKKYIGADANEDTQISALLPYVLASSRFAHYIKIIMREKIGSFMTRANIESYLNTWISQYVLLDDNASEEAKAAFPLRAANIVVTEVEGQVGSYQATIFIKPHFQMEDLTTSIRLVTSLPS